MLFYLFIIYYTLKKKYIRKTYEKVYLKYFCGSPGKFVLRHIQLKNKNILMGLILLANVLKYYRVSTGQFKRLKRVFQEKNLVRTNNMLLKK